MEYPIVFKRTMEFIHDGGALVDYFEGQLGVNPHDVYNGLKEHFDEEDADSLDAVRHEFRAYESYVDEVTSEVNGLFDELECVCDYLESGKRGKTKEIIAADIRRLMRNCKSNLEW